MSEIIVVDEDGRIIKKDKEEGHWLGITERRAIIYKGKPMIITLRHMMGIKGMYKKVMNDDIPEKDKKEIEKNLN